MVDILKDEFISSDITDNIIYYNPNYYKYMGYILDYYNTKKNDLDIAIIDISIEKYHTYNSCIYKNINNWWYNLTLQLLSVIDNIKTIAMTLDITIIVIFYYNKCQLILLNDWEDLYCFNTVFLYLFLFRNRSHLKQ